MRILKALGLTAVFCLMAVSAQAQSAKSDALSTCGSITYDSGFARNDTMDTTGRKCVNGVLVLGGAAVSSANPLPVIDASPIPTQQSGVAAPVIGCDKHALYDASDNGSKTIVAGVSAKKVYVCGFILSTGGSATNLSLSSGTGTDCVSTSVNITPAYQLLANDRVGGNSAFWNGLITLAVADNLCIKASAGNAHTGEVWYTIQ